MNESRWNLEKELTERLINHPLTENCTECYGTLRVPSGATYAGMHEMVGCPECGFTIDLIAGLFVDIMSDRKRMTPDEYYKAWEGIQE